jgi:MFS family permease
MYGLAPLVGRFVDRVGRIRAVSVGAIVLGLGVLATVLAGYVPALMFVGLFFLGLGWNVGLIAGSTLLTSSVPATSRVEVQGTSDLAMSAGGATAAFSSGFVKASFGFHVLADVAVLFAAGLLVYAWLAASRMRAAVPASS